ncbi:helix-turn-helix transcriptional regulator [Microbacterium ureisolvens]|uniref:HTH luxR-type domain-containing protein n=1 Tax=Microbacterium ureisolvens TaxID=2781186 RepID=A0ABS7I374_9MICO|nr:helix-turn-helix transcriptional regulator [Microbacterium ureisolvens]MBW9111998.1 hypothetical protein [Microbacterium ureisolvens]
MPSTTMTVAAFFDATTFTGSRHARPLIDALTSHDMPPRVLISGNAGSGKTTMLRGAQRFLTQQRAEVSVLGPETDVLDVPASSILLVDDLHLLPAAQVEGLGVRASDPDAALVVTSRPWPHSHALSSIARHLERSRPAVMLGHLTRSDVLDHLEANERTLKPECLDHLLEVTGGVAWLVSAALAAHDDRDCADDGTHAALGNVLEQSVAHRMGVVDEDVRRAIEAMSVRSDDAPVLADALDDESVIAQGYAEGLLLRNGRPVPVVRSAVRANLSARRLVDLIAAMPDGMDPLVSRTGGWLADVRDPRLSSTLVEHGDQLLESDPARAGELYRAAAEAGPASADLAAKRAQAAWSCGDIDSAAQLVDDAMTFDDRSESVTARIADVAAATWSMRGMLHTGSGFYDAFPPTTAEASVRRSIARIGVGEAGAAGPDDASAPEIQRAAPSTLGVAMNLLQRGLQTSLRADHAEAAVTDLVRASHLYTASRSSTPMPEHPAVIAAVAAISAGDLATARAVVDAAIEGHQGTPWVMSRLLLWKSWIALQQARGARAREALEAAVALTPKPAARDELLVQAIRVGLARRYEDAAGLEAAWERGRDGLLDADIDLYTLLPLVEFVSAGARVGDEAVTEPLFTRALALVDALGRPALWSAHLRWAGIQRGILRNRPESLSSHAHALVDAAPHSAVAETMAKAGRLWTSVLAGSVDVDEVDTAAQSLAAIGLRWDAARLAGQGAGRSDDRKVSARLLARARELFPQEKPAVAEASGPNAETPPGTVASVLSERETDVARLVVEGKTYAEIGETIFISPRTAEHHIASIRRRLGATSRSDLIAKLRIALAQTRPLAEDG